jgi:hypothetical protein
MPSSSGLREELISTYPLLDSPSKTRTWRRRVGSWMMTASGWETGSRARISVSWILQKASTGAPMRSDPKLGKAWAHRPSLNAAIESISAAVTTP